MLSSDIFSVTDLRTKIGNLLKNLVYRPQFLFKNNKLVGVVISPKEYDLLYGDDIYTNRDEAAYQEFLNDKKNGEVYSLGQAKELFDV